MENIYRTAHSFYIFSPFSFLLSPLPFFSFQLCCLLLSIFSALTKSLLDLAVVKKCSDKALLPPLVLAIQLQPQAFYSQSSALRTKQIPFLVRVELFHYITAKPLCVFKDVPIIYRSLLSRKFFCLNSVIR